MANFIRIVDPTYGRIITFEINVTNEIYRNAYVQQLQTLAKAFDAAVRISGNKVTITFTNENHASIFKKQWEERH